MTFGEQVRLAKEILNEALVDKIATKDAFQRTNTDRCTTLFQQLKQHEKHLEKFLYRLRNHEHDSRELLNGTRAVLSVPALVDLSHPPNTMVPAPVGRDAPLSMGPLTCCEASPLTTAVILPCEHWLAEFGLLKGERMPVLQKARLDLDSRRRKDVKLHAALQSAQAKVPPTDPIKHDKYNRRIEQAAQLMAHKQSKLNCSAKTFFDEEAAVYQTLLALAHETQLAPTHVAAAVRLFQDFFTHAAELYPEASHQAPAAWSALQGSNHHDLWRDATAPIVVPPVLPVQPVDPFHSQLRPSGPSGEGHSHSNVPPVDAYRTGAASPADPYSHVAVAAMRHPQLQPAHAPAPPTPATLAAAVPVDSRFSSNIVALGYPYQNGPAVQHSAAYQAVKAALLADPAYVRSPMSREMH